MKRVILLCTFLFVAKAFAIPQLINYQGQLADDGGAPLDTTVAMTFNIWPTPSGGTPDWTETHSTITVTDGLFNVILGSVNPLSDLFFANRWLGITIGSDTEMIPRQQIVSVAHAYRVGTVDGSSGGTISGKLNVGSANTNSGFVANVFGQNNSARGDYSVVSGGGSATPTDSNSAAGHHSTIPGGSRNEAAGAYSFAAGHRAKAFHTGSFVWADSSSIDFPSTANNQFLIRASGNVGIGTNVPAERLEVNGDVKADTFRADVGIRFPDGTLQTTAAGNLSGYQQDLDTNFFDATRTWVQSHGYLFGPDNVVDEQFYCFVGGGSNNSATNQLSAIGGGSGNNASNNAATIAGGIDNIASEFLTTIGGGSSNTASGGYATVSGGRLNSAIGMNSCVGGGRINTARADYSVVCGGGGIGTADSNSARGDASIILGGRRNETTGIFSLAAGFRAKALHEGAFVWADSTGANFASTAADEFSVRASGGVRFATTSTGTIGVKLDAGDTGWEILSDSTTKTNRRSVDTKSILEKVSQLPIEEWNYKHQDESNTHIGPMAQDFHSLFGYGDDDKSISTIDPDGIALAAIQELQKRTQKIEQLEAEVAELKLLVNQLIQLGQK